MTLSLIRKKGKCDFKKLLGPIRHVLVIGLIRKYLRRNY